MVAPHQYANHMPNANFGCKLLRFSVLSAAARISISFSRPTSGIFLFAFGTLPHPQLPIFYFGAAEEAEAAGLGVGVTIVMFTKNMNSYPIDAVSFSSPRRIVPPKKRMSAWSWNFVKANRG